MTDDDDRRLEAELRQIAGADPSPGEVHLSDDRLTEIARQGRGPDPVETVHLARCSECCALIAYVTRSPPEPEGLARRRRWRMRAVGATAALCAVAALVVYVVGRPKPIVPRDTRVVAQNDTTLPPGYRSRGGETILADVQFVAVGPDGTTRDLHDGDRVDLRERLGFTYGNPSGAAHDLTILGWDGREVHWYYPEAEGRAPVRLESGPSARGVRLPFDIRIAEKHRAGQLTLVAGFDVNPAELARLLRQGTGGSAPRTHTVALQVVEGAP